MTWRERRCPYCARRPIGPGQMCDHTSLTDHDDWATGNRIMCDFIHRGIIAPGDLTAPPFPLHVMPEEIGAPAVA